MLGQPVTSSSIGPLHTGFSGCFSQDEGDSEAEKTARISLKRGARPRAEL